MALSNSNEYLYFLQANLSFPWRDILVVEGTSYYTSNIIEIHNYIRRIMVGTRNSVDNHTDYKVVI